MWIAEATATGPGVIGMRGKLHDPSAQPHPQTFRCFLVALQFLLASEHAVRQGVVMVVDAEGIGWDNFSLDAERSYMEGMTGLPWQYPGEAAAAAPAPCPGDRGTPRGAGDAAAADRPRAALQPRLQTGGSTRPAPRDAARPSAPPSSRSLPSLPPQPSSRSTPPCS